MQQVKFNHFASCIHYSCFLTRKSVGKAKKNTHIKNDAKVYCFTVCDKEFPERAKTLGKSIIVGGENYGQGSSREHAALAPLFLGVKAVLVKSFARIHKSNLINAGILPLTFQSTADYDKIKLGDMLELPNVKKEIADGSAITVVNKTTGETIIADCELSDRTRAIILAGGLLDYTKENS